MNKDNSTFFIACPIHTEQLCLNELKFVLSHQFNFIIQEFKLDSGGIEIDLPIMVGFKLNLHLKIATRILLRLENFKCRDLPKLFKKAQRIDYRIYSTQNNFKFVVSSSKSRLLHTGRIENTLNDAIDKYYQANPIAKKDTQLQKQSLFKTNLDHFSLYCRIHEDICSISIDTTGESLYKRNLKKKFGHAPLRENLASAVIQWKKSNSVTTSDTTENEKKYVLDPMCGSGTYLSEIFNLYKANTDRSFAFESFLMTLKTPLPDDLEFANERESNYIQYIGIEKDLNTYNICVKNLQSINNKKIVNDDFKLVNYEKILDKKTDIFSNPPYGTRIKTPEKNFYISIFDFFKSKDNINSITLILPSNITQIKQYEQKQIIINGGIKTSIYHWSRQ